MDIWPSTINTTNIPNLNQSDVTTYILVGHSERAGWIVAHTLHTYILFTLDLFKNLYTFRSYLGQSSGSPIKYIQVIKIP
jgi:hypothetical protein